MSDEKKTLQQRADEIRMEALESLRTLARFDKSSYPILVEQTDSFVALARAITELAGPPGRPLEASPLGAYAQPEHPEREAVAGDDPGGHPGAKAISGLIEIGNKVEKLSRDLVAAKMDLTIALARHASDTSIRLGFTLDGHPNHWEPAKVVEWIAKDRAALVDRCLDLAVDADSPHEMDLARQVLRVLGEGPGGTGTYNLTVKDYEDLRARRRAAVPSHIDEPAEGSFPRGQRA